MKRRTRMYEPWGYQDQNDYQGAGVILENDLDSFFAEVSYNKDDNKIHFANKDGEEKATLDVNEFVKSQVIVERAWYENGSIHVKFTNGDEIVVDVKELLDETEFKDGLQVVEGQVSVLINTVESDEYISVGETGIKLFGVKRDIEAEEARATSAETALDEKIDAEIERATGAEETLDEKIDAEIERATAEETRIDTKLDQEIARATAEEAAANRRIDSLNDELDAEKTIREGADAALGRRIDKEIDDRTADVDEEEARAIAAEEALDAKIDQEIVNREADVDAEETRAKAAEQTIDEKIDQEIADRTADVNAEEARAISAETELQGAVEAEGQRASDAENALDIAKADKADAVASAEYIKSNSAATINFKNISGDIISSIDATDFVVDGMIEDVKIENGNLVITFNTDAGKQDITIPLTEIFDPSNYYTKTEIDEKVTTINESIAGEVAARESGDTALESKITALEDVAATKAALEAEIARATSEEGKKVERTIQGSNGKALVFNESDGGGAKFEHSDGTWSFAGVNDGGENGIAGQVYAVKKNAENKMEGTRIDITKDAMYYTVGSDSAADRMVAANEIAVKGDIPTDFYTQEEVDEIVAEKANADAVYTKDEVDAIAGAKADADAVYTKAEVDAELAEKADASAIPSVADFFDGAAYDSSAKTINFYNGETLKAQIDASEFVVDGMVEDVKIEDGKLVITFNTDSGKETIEIPLTEIFDPSNYYTKAEVDTELAKKTDYAVNGTNGKALMFNETDGGGAKFEHTDGTWSFAGVNDGGENGIAGQIYALKKNAEDKFEGTRIDVTKNAMYYTVGAEAAADRMVAANEIATKGNIDTIIAEKDAIINKLNSDLYTLTTIVGNIDGVNVTYELPSPYGKSFNTLMGNNGTVKLTEDVTTGRFGPGITAKNKVALNINNHNLTISGLTESSAQAAIMARGTQEITIGGKGTIDAGQGMCIEANGASSVINLTGSTTTYHTNRPGGELIYCYAGTINISNGTFRNDGASNYTLNCYDANYRNGTAKIIVTGGKFYDFNPADNSAEGEHTNFLAEGYHVEESTVVEEGVEHTVYTVKKDV